MDHRAALVVLLRQRLETLLDAMPAAQAGDVHSVHQARVATRRLREALPVLRASVDSHALTRARQQVREMTRALGPVRELDVALQHLDEFVARGVFSARALTRVRQTITRERLERRQQMLIAITPGKVEKLRLRLTAVGSGPPIGGKPGAIREASRQVGKRAGRLAHAIERAGALYSPERLHAIRVAAKKLRYALEIERELKRSRVTARIRQLKTLQDELGRMHDFEMLADHAKRLQAQVAGSDRRLATDLDAVVRAIDDDCRLIHAGFMRRRESILRLCAVVTPQDDNGTAVA
jgi:CHAD domain-containing protein